MKVRSGSIALALLLGACGGQTLDSASVEEQVLQELQASGSPVTAVSCPDDVEVEAGSTFTCEGTTGDGPWTIEVAQRDDQGTLEFEIVGT